MKKLLLLPLLAVLAAMALSGCITSNDSQNTVRIGYLPIVASLPLYVSQEKGFFEEQGITVEATQFQSSNALVEALVAGKIDAIAETSAVPALAAEAISPGKLKFFSTSDITEQAPFDNIIVLKNSTISSLEELEGKKIGVFPGSTATFFLKKFLKDNGIGVTGIQFVQLPPQNQLAALQAGSVDALHSYEPTTTIALEAGIAKSLYGSVYAKILNHNPQGAGVISTKFIAEKPELAKKAVAAFDKTFDYMQSNEQDVRENIIPKYAKLSPQVAGKVVLLYMSRSDKINVEALQSYADLLFEMGELKQKVNVSQMVYSAKKSSQKEAS